MKALLAIGVLALIGGCASDPVQVAQAECKVAPVTTAGYAAQHKTQKVDRLDQRKAQADLANSDFRRMQLAQHGGIQGNLLEEALRDCNR